MLAILLLVCWSCQKPMEEPTEPEIEPPKFIPPNLKGTAWKLEGIADTVTNTLTVLEPKECEWCYTFKFDTDTTAHGISVINEVLIRGLNPIYYYGADWGEIGDAGIYRNAFRYGLIKSFTADNDELRLFFDDIDNKRKYFLYKQTTHNINMPDEDLCTIENLWEQPLHVIQECVHGKWKVLEISNRTTVGHFYPINNIVDIDTLNNTIMLTTAENDIGSYMHIPPNVTFSYSWEYKEVYGMVYESTKPHYSTYVMQNNDHERKGWFFHTITKDMLHVVVDYNPPNLFEKYLFLKIKE